MRLLGNVQHWSMLIWFSYQCSVFLPILPDAFSLFLQNINFRKKKLRSGKIPYSRMKDFQNGIYSLLFLESYCCCSPDSVMVAEMQVQGWKVGRWLGSISLHVLSKISTSEYLNPSLEQRKQCNSFREISLIFARVKFSLFLHPRKMLLSSSLEK